jgi:hypothetical protein
MPARQLAIGLLLVVTTIRTPVGTVQGVPYLLQTVNAESF